MPFNAAEAKQAAARSAQVRARRKDPNTAARDKLLLGAKAAAEVLKGVAQADSGFEDVKPELRFKAAALILEYVLGKPRGIEEEPEEKAAEPTFLDLLAPPGDPDGIAEQKLIRYREDGPR